MLYDQFFPTDKDEQVDVMVQYSRRTPTDSDVTDQGRFLSLTFDKLTVRTTELVINKSTLMVDFPKAVSIDFGGPVSHAERARLDARRRDITMFSADTQDQRRF